MHRLIAHLRRQRLPSAIAFLSIAINASVAVSENPGQKAITHKGSHYRIVSGSLRRNLYIGHDSVSTRSVKVSGDEVLAEPSSEFQFTLRYASPDRKPQALKPGEGGSIDATAIDSTTNMPSIHEEVENGTQDVNWVRPLVFNGSKWGKLFDAPQVETWERNGVHHLTIAGRAATTSIECALHYESYDGFPAIRKWIEITNHGSHWLKLDQLRIESWTLLAASARHATALTPSERGAPASLIAMGNAERSRGLILGNEIPSALRDIAANGSMGYTDQYFEWVLGPGESFRSEPVFEYAYTGEIVKTISAPSTPLDRTIENRFQHFLRERIHLLADSHRLTVPTFSTWSNYGPHIDDASIRKLAILAAQGGFGLLQVDDGWQRGRLGAEPDVAKFPDFKATSDFVESKGLRLGLWVSTFRSPGDHDFSVSPDGASRPAIHRLGGSGMAFASSWRTYYAHSLAELARTYGVTYFKQDFSNIRFGDFAEGHESRTLKESLLRGLRGLLDAQDAIHSERPEVTLELTHEIYWGTPGVPCDLAALKHANVYHVPPNDYSGAGNRSETDRSQWKFDPATLRRELIAGSLHARQRFYDHRGLPLDAIEYYGAATVNFRGSLTRDVQDRQIASWLMGAPMVYAGDLTSLTAENLSTYKERFTTLRQLQSAYSIYDYFEFSGVPSAPTDQGWQWWGKLNDAGYGAVVVLRGEGGEAFRNINIPWVVATTLYKVSATLSGKELGTYSGKDLQDGRLSLVLPTYGQEILALSPASAQ